MSSNGRESGACLLSIFSSYRRGQIGPWVGCSRSQVAPPCLTLVDLRWDIIARFGPLHPELPPAFFSDFAKMALDESKHLYVDEEVKAPI